MFVDTFRGRRAILIRTDNYVAERFARTKSYMGARRHEEALVRLMDLYDVAVEVFGEKRVEALIKKMVKCGSGSS